MTSLQMHHLQTIIDLKYSINGYYQYLINVLRAPFYAFFRGIYRGSNECIYRGSICAEIRSSQQEGEDMISQHKLYQNIVFKLHSSLSYVMTRFNFIRAYKTILCTTCHFSKIHIEILTMAIHSRKLDVRRRFRTHFLWNVRFR